MQNIINSLKNFFEIEKIDDNNIIILNSFYLINTNNIYPINVKKIDNNTFIIHDAMSIIHFINEYNLEIDNNKLNNLLNEFSDIKIDEDSVITCTTNLNNFNINLAKYIQFITNLVS